MKKVKGLVFFTVIIVFFVCIVVVTSSIVPDESLALTAGDGGGAVEQNKCTGELRDNGDGSISPVDAEAGYSCCGSNMNTSCPKWIVGSAADFAQAANYQFPNKNAYDQGKIQRCLNGDGPIYWFGNVKDAKANGGLSMRNDYASPNQKNLVLYDARTGTYSQMDIPTINYMLYAANSIGTTTTGLAFWCDALFEDCEETGTCPEEKKEDTCEDWSVGGSRTTGVAAGVQNVTIGTGYVKQNDTSHGLNTNAWVWAKPGDTIKFCDQYYSGLQDTRNDMVTIVPYTLPDAYHATEVNYKGNNHGSQDEPVKGPAQTSLMEFLGGSSVWVKNGFSVSGRGGGFSSEDYGANAGAYNYKWESNAITVDPLADIGESHLENNVQEVKSDFNPPKSSGSPTTANFSTSYNDYWDCNPYTPVSSQEAHGSMTKAQCDGIENSSAVPGGDNVNPNTIVMCYYSVEVEGGERMSRCHMDPAVVNFNGFTGDATASAYFKVPYNYINYGDAEINTSIIYSGEQVHIKAFAVTGIKSNALTKGTYATIVPEAKYKVAGYISDSSDGSGPNMPSGDGGCPNNNECVIYKSESGITLNPNGNYGGDSKEVDNNTYSVWDVEAGRYYCVMTMVYPATSGGDGNMSGVGDGQWSYSNPVCKVISKKPTFQIRGSMYIEGGSITQGNVANKNNISNTDSGKYTFTADSKDDNTTRSFYSWVDQSLTIGRQASFYQFSSGAASNVKTDGIKSNNVAVGGVDTIKDTKKFLTRSMQPLTLPTPPASVGDTLQGIGAVLNSSFKSTVVNSIVKRSDSDVEKRCEVNDEFVAVNGQRRVIYCSGSPLQINANIVYKSASGDNKFSNANEIPSIIIYADNGIKIAPGVTTIDAWVITNGTINTCSSTEKDADGCNVPLTINGTVLANKIELNRTYGAGAGARASYPAELFNLSLASYLYSASAAKSTAGNSVQTVYMRELAPRF